MHNSNLDACINCVVPLPPSPRAGLFSCIMRDLANMSTDFPKWIVLDGDIDPMWIESLNTVMDDNKVAYYTLQWNLPIGYLGPPQYTYLGPLPLWIPWGRGEVSCIESYFHFRGFRHSKVS